MGKEIITMTGIVRTYSTETDIEEQQGTKRHVKDSCYSY